VTGSLTLLRIEGAKGVRMQPLDGGGRPLGAAQNAVRDAEGWRLVVGNPATPWYTVDVQR
jgi:hypothetical protein